MKSTSTKLLAKEVDFTPADAAAALGRAREFVAAVGSVISSAG